jgi:hypothetical protein
MLVKYGTTSQARDKKSGIPFTLESVGNIDILALKELPEAAEDRIADNEIVLYKHCYGSRCNTQFGC